MLQRSIEHDIGADRNVATLGGRDEVLEAETVNAKHCKIGIIHVIVKSKK